MQERLKVIDIAMAGLAIFALCLLAASIIFELTPEQEELFGWIDLGVCAIFITELGFRFHNAPSKRRCLRESWADILGSIPTTEMEMRVIRGFRVFRVGRAARVARVAKAAKVLKVARKLPKLRKTKKFRKRKRHKKRYQRR